MRTVAAVVLLALLIVVPASSQIIQESGSLRGFLASSNPNSAYDNWVSHIVEGIADPGYNDYGPEELDPQTDGFGSFRFIPNTPGGDATLEHWDAIFNAMFAGDLQTAATLVEDSLETFHYETVQFTDVVFGREYWIIREQLDMSFIDTSNTSDPADDIHGSFRNGWGVFVFNPEATRSNVMIQVVHPCDDFFAPYAAIELFLGSDAATLCINGTGREVMWTEQGSYSNSKSLSDPSRNPDLPLQRFHERFTDKFADHYPYPAIAIQLHSYDPSHTLHTPNIISAGYYYSHPFMPLRDRRQEGRDIAHMTPHPVFEEGEYVGSEGPLEELAVNQYYAINSVEQYFVHISEEDSLLVPRATTLRGDPSNQQDRYMHDRIHNYYALQVIEPFVHVEMDEYPSYLEEGGVERAELFNVQLIPPRIGTYQPMLEFYYPFLNAVENWIAWLEVPYSINTPPQIQGIEAFSYGDGKVWIKWEPIEDGHLYTYEILADTEELNEDSPVVWTQDDDPWLRALEFEDWTVVTSLPLDATYNVAVRIRDLGGNVGPLSLPLQVDIADTIGIQLEVTEVSDFPAEAWPMWISALPAQQDIASITLQWRLNGNDQDDLTLEPVGELGYWAVALPENLEVQPADEIMYRLVTRDLSLDGNELMFPSEGAYSVILSATTSVFELVDFETTQGYIDLAGDWAIGAPEFGPDEPVSGENVLATNPAGPYTNVGSSMARLINRVQPQYGPLLMVYEQWVEYEEDAETSGAAVDGGNVGSDWDDYELLTPIGGYSHRITDGAYEDEDVFSGSSGGWETVVVDLHPMYGAHADINFNSVTLGETGLAGWYLDDVRFVRVVNQQEPAQFNLLSPADGDPAPDLNVPFTWEACVDTDPYAVPEYTLFLTANEQVYEIPASTEPGVIVSLEDLDLAANGPPSMSWTVRAISQGDTVMSTQTFTLLNPFSAVGEDENQLPDTYALHDVWPNPFNSTLSLRYSLPKQDRVRAVLYNILGQQVAVIENRMQVAGTHRLSWHAQELASGVYILRMETGGQTFTRKLVLMK